jgi:GNAT superfamily N-acetyltransferase
VLLSDLALARRLERAEGGSCARFAETRARLTPESGARWVEVAGACAVYDGVTSPLTQTFGLGLFQQANPADLEAIEGFYRERGAPVFHEVSPLADAALLPLLSERGYHPVELTSVLFRPTRGGPPPAAPRNPGIQVRLVREDEHESWAQTAARGWGEVTEFADSILGLMRISAKRPDGLAFLAELDGQPLAAALMVMSEGVALLAGASTIPAGRRQGAQRALLESRLRYAAEHDCDLAMMCASPGSASQRNAERQGFRIAYTRIKWGLARSAAEPAARADRPGE